MTKKKIDYTPKTLEKRNQQNKIHPVAAGLSELFIKALMANPPLHNTAWCIELALASTGWELDAIAKVASSKFSGSSKIAAIALSVQNKLKEKIEKDKGVKIR